MLHRQRAVRADKMRRTEVDVTAEAVTGLGAGFASLPSWTLDENQLADLEMLLSGVFAPLTGFMTAADVSAVCESGTLADGFPWPVPVTLDVPEDAVPPAQRRLALNDPEGVAKQTAGAQAVISGEMEPDLLVRGGETLSLGGGVTVSVHSIPGHTAGSVAYLLDGQRSVFVGDGPHDGFGRLPQASVDDVHAGVAQGPRHDLDAAIVAVEADLGDQDAGT